MCLRLFHTSSDRLLGQELYAEDAAYKHSSITGVLHFVSHAEDKRRSENVTAGVSSALDAAHPRCRLDTLFMILTPDEMIGSRVRGETPQKLWTITLSGGLAPDCLRNTPSSHDCRI